MNKKSATMKRIARERADRRRYLFLWVIAATLIIGLLWQVLETLLYGGTQPRMVDDIIAIAYIVAMLKIYYMGRDDGRNEYSEHPIRDGRISIYSDKSGVYVEVKLLHPDANVTTIKMPYGLDDARRIKKIAEDYIEGGNENV